MNETQEITLFTETDPSMVWATIIMGIATFVMAAATVGLFLNASKLTRITQDMAQHEYLTWVLDNAPQVVFDNFGIYQHSNSLMLGLTGRLINRGGRDAIMNGIWIEDIHYKCTSRLDCRGGKVQFDPKKDTIKIKPGFNDKRSLEVKLFYCDDYDYRFRTNGTFRINKNKYELRQGSERFRPFRFDVMKSFFLDNDEWPP